MALVTAAAFKTAMGIGDTGRDTQIAALITLVEAWVSNFCNRIFEDGSTSRTEYFDGDGLTGVIFPKYYPIVSVASLHDDTDRSYGSGTLIDADDYVAYDGHIELDGFVFNKGLKNIKLTYVGGYVTTGESANVPDALKFAIYKAISWNLDRMGKESLASQSVASQNIATTFVMDIPADARRMLMKYRRPAFGA